MRNHDTFEKINTTMDLASTANDDVLGGVVILSAVFTEFCLADLICAEADKVEKALYKDSGVPELTDLDNSVANVLKQICCIEEQINKKIEQGRAIKKGV